MRILHGETFVRDMVLFSVKAAPARAIMERTGYLFSTDGFEGRWDGEHQNIVHAIERILINFMREMATNMPDKESDAILDWWMGDMGSMKAFKEHYTKYYPGNIEPSKEQIQTLIGDLETEFDKFEYQNIQAKVKLGFTGRCTFFDSLAYDIASWVLKYFEDMTLMIMVQDWKEQS